MMAKILSLFPTDYRFQGRVIRLNERDYDQWKRVYHAIPDFDAELQRIDDSELPQNWFCAVSAKLAAKHQKFISQAKTAKAVKLPNSPPPLSAYVDLIKAAHATNKRWLAPKDFSAVIEAYRKGLITADEASFCGYRPNPRGHGE